MEKKVIILDGSQAGILNKEEGLKLKEILKLIDGFGFEIHVKNFVTNAND